MDIRSNEPFWLVTNAFQKSYPSLDKSISTEILVIGGGITGALIAYKLISEGKKVVLVDRRDVCNGSSAASTAMLQYEIDVPLFQLIEKRGIECAVTSFRECENAIFELAKISKKIKSDCGFEFKKSIWFTTSKKQLPLIKSEYETRKRYGFDVKWLEKSDLQQLGIKALAGIESASAAIMDPYKFTYDLLIFNQEKGLKVYDRTEISKIKKSDSAMIATTSNNITIKVEQVIHCTGYESINTLNKNVVNLKSTYAMTSESFDELPIAFRNHIYWDTASPYIYLRSTKDNRIIIGGGDENFKNGKLRDALLPKKQKFLLKKFSDIFNDINFKPDYSWAGTFGETDDGLPYMGKPKEEINEHYVLGFGGNGITYSVMAMDAILDSINASHHPYLEFYKFDR